ncbi:protein of unknown function DUF2815 [Vibrio phage 1.050.O._10N.286.48.A6]|nr:protein of unknown function DUF2815 [Vibrio phage 1.050.O._10N.286.48.A6]
MANKNVFTGYFRAIFPHLATPRGNPQKPTDPAKYQITALFPQNGITTITGTPESGLDSLLGALDELCRQEFQVDWATLSANHVAYGIQYPPKFNDGNQDYLKDDNGNPLQPFQTRPESAGMWKISFKNSDPVDCVAPSGVDNIAPSEIYGGCWCRAEVQVSAYVNKNKQKVIAIKLINIQKAFDDQPLGGGAEPKKAGTQSFAQMAVAGTNIAPGTGVVHGAVAQPGALPAPGAQADTHIINPTLAAQGHTLESMMQAGWDLVAMIGAGHAIANPAAQAPAPQQVAAQAPAPQQMAAPQQQAPAPAPAPGMAPAPQQPGPCTCTCTGYGTCTTATGYGTCTTATGTSTSTCTTATGTSTCTGYGTSPKPNGTSPKPNGTYTGCSGTGYGCTCTCPYTCTGCTCPSCAERRPRYYESR